jgi:hypothetical protein
MAINTVSAKMNVPANGYVNLYTCASDKSHALVDLDLLNIGTSDANVKIAIANKAYSQLTVDDYILHNLLLSTVDNQANISGIFIGKNESIYIESQGASVNVRLSGIEETNPHVAASGQLASATYAPNTNPYQLYQTNIATATATSCYLNIYNPNSSTSNIEIYVSSNTTPTISDLVYKGDVIAGQTICMDKLLINQSEKIFVKVSNASIRVYLNGVVISS